MPFLVAALFATLAATSLWLGVEVTTLQVARTVESFGSVVDHYSGAQPAALQPDLVTLHVVAVAIVVLWYRTHFGEWSPAADKPLGYPPRPARDFTSWLRYQVWALLYAGVGVVLLYVVFLLPEFVAALAAYAAQLAGKSEPTGVLGALLDLAAGLAPPDEATLLQRRAEGADVGAVQGTRLLAAGTAVAVAVTMIPAFDNRLRAVFQRGALIPFHAKRLAELILAQPERFHVPEARLREFVVRFDADPDNPYLYSAELTRWVDDARGLATYPRLEYLRAQFDRLLGHQSLGVNLVRYKADVTAMDADLAALRRDVRRLREGLVMFDADDRGQAMAELHEHELGEPPSSQGWYGLTLLHRFVDLVRGPGLRTAGSGLDEAARPFEPADAAATRRLHAAERALMSQVDDQLRILRRESDRIHAHLVRVAVCASLASTRLMPQAALREFGFDVAESRQEQIDWNRYLVIGLVVAAVMVGSVAGYAYLVPGAGVREAAWLPPIFAMMIPATLGGFVFGVMLVNDRIARGALEPGTSFRVADFVATTLMGWSMAVFGLFVLAQLRGTPGTHDQGWPWTFLPAVAGAAVAWALHRQKAGLKPWTARQGLLLVPLFLLASFTSLAMRAGGFVALAQGGVSPHFLGFVVIVSVLLAAALSGALLLWRAEPQR